VVVGVVATGKAPTRLECANALENPSSPHSLALRSRSGQAPGGSLGAVSKEEPHSPLCEGTSLFAVVAIVEVAAIVMVVIQVTFASSADLASVIISS
jgi:hypothetical protein